MTVVLHYTKAILRDAIRNYLRRVYWHRFFRLTAFSLFILALAVYVGSVWFWTLALTPIILMPIMFAVGYNLRLRESFKKLGLLDRGTAMLTLSENGILLDSAMGKSEIHWDLFNGLWEFSTLYLLLFTSHQFITLPKDQVTDEFVEYIRTRVKPF